MTIAAVVAARHKRLERKLTDHLRERGALSPTAATRLDAQRGMSRSVLRSLLRYGAVVEIPGDLYWLNEAAYTEMRARRRRRIAWIMALVLAISAITIAMIFAFVRTR